MAFEIHVLYLILGEKITKKLKAVLLDREEDGINRQSISLHNQS